MFLDGSMAIGCGCEFSSQLTTRYSAWHLGINATSDIQTGPLTWIRSIELIGGRTRTRQTLNQTDSFEFYTSQTKLYWSDVGAKVGLGVTMPLSPAVEFGLGGTLAVVHRHVRLHGQDRLDDSLGTLFETSIGATANTWAVVPGGQAQLLFRAHPQMQVRVFGGLQWDSRVPGIVSPHFSPDQLFTFMGDPASIGFSGQTSYFVGGGFTYAFNR
jgi:hypothetical protein